MVKSNSKFPISTSFQPNEEHIEKVSKYIGHTLDKDKNWNIQTNRDGNFIMRVWTNHISISIPISRLIPILDTDHEEFKKDILISIL